MLCAWVYHQDGKKQALAARLSGQTQRCGLWMLLTCVSGPASCRYRWLFWDLQASLHCTQESIHISKAQCGHVQPLKCHILSIFQGFIYDNCVFSIESFFSLYIIADMLSLAQLKWKTDPMKVAFLFCIGSNWFNLEYSLSQVGDGHVLTGNTDAAFSPKEVIYDCDQIAALLQKDIQRSVRGPRFMWHNVACVHMGASSSPADWVLKQPGLSQALLKRQGPPLCS